MNHTIIARQRVAGGRITRPNTCTLHIPPDLLTAAGYADQQHAHDQAACVRLWRLARQHQQQHGRRTARGVLNSYLGRAA